MPGRERAEGLESSRRSSAPSRVASDAIGTALFRPSAVVARYPPDRMPAAKPTYSISRWVFLRGLALVFLIAFLSLWVQIDGLIGSRGILPVAEFIGNVRRFSSDASFLDLPTLSWWSASDASLHLQGAAGVLLSLALLVGFAPRASLILLWALYLSLTTAGQVFLSFQWDVLLLETAVFAI